MAAREQIPAEPHLRRLGARDRGAPARRIDTADTRRGPSRPRAAPPARADRALLLHPAHSSLSAHRALFYIDHKLGMSASYIGGLGVVVALYPALRVVSALQGRASEQPRAIRLGSADALARPRRRAGVLQEERACRTVPVPPPSASVVTVAATPPAVMTCSADSDCAWSYKRRDDCCVNPCAVGTAMVRARAEADATYNATYCTPERRDQCPQTGACANKPQLPKRLKCSRGACLAVDDVDAGR